MAECRPTATGWRCGVRARARLWVPVHVLGWDDVPLPPGAHPESCRSPSSHSPPASMAPAWRWGVRPWDHRGAWQPSDPWSAPWGSLPHRASGRGSPDHRISQGSAPLVFSALPAPRLCQHFDRHLSVGQGCWAEGGTALGRACVPGPETGWCGEQTPPLSCAGVPLHLSPHGALTGPDLGEAVTAGKNCQSPQVSVGEGSSVL